MVGINRLFKMGKRILIRLTGKKEAMFISPSFPKTGNTWLRIQLGQYTKKLYGLQELPLFDGVFPDTYHGPRGIFTHGALTWDEQTADDLTFENAVEPYLSEKIVFLVRNPLDILVSHYFDTRRYGGYTGDLYSFTQDAVFGYEKLQRYFLLWSPVRKSKHYFEVRYEKRLQNPDAVLKDLVLFLGFPLNKEYIEDAVRASTFENMRKMEISRKLTYPSSGLEVFGNQKNPDKNNMFVRKGVANGYTDYFSSAEIRQLSSQLMPFCKEFQYNL